MNPEQIQSLEVLLLAMLPSEHNKARSVGPGPLPAQPWCRPTGVGRSCAVG
jgi:hypothetical protein